jgi:hypothetical protein
MISACAAKVDDANGDAIRWRPICSTTGTTSASVKPTPPCASGIDIAVHQLADAVDGRFVAAKARGYIQQLDLFFAISKPGHLHVILSSRP